MTQSSPRELLTPIFFLTTSGSKPRRKNPPIGIQEAYLSTLESGKKEPCLEVIQMLAEGLGRIAQKIVLGVVKGPGFIPFWVFVYPCAMYLSG